MVFQYFNVSAHDTKSFLEQDNTFYPSGLWWQKSRIWQYLLCMAGFWSCYNYISVSRVHLCQKSRSNTVCSRSSSILTKVVMRPRLWELPKLMLRKCQSRFGFHNPDRKTASAISDESTVILSLLQPSIWHPLIRYLCLLVFLSPHSLTNEQSRQNWEMYGNPDGPGGKRRFSQSHSRVWIFKCWHTFCAWSWWVSLSQQWTC